MVWMMDFALRHLRTSKTKKSAANGAHNFIRCQCQRTCPGCHYEHSLLTKPLAKGQRMWCLVRTRVQASPKEGRPRCCRATDAAASKRPTIDHRSCGAMLRWTANSRRTHSRQTPRTSPNLHTRTFDSSQDERPCRRKGTSFATAGT